MKDWDHLRVILAVARAGGLSGAARLIGVNHATVSRQLARAEVDVGAQLFERLPTGMVPTEAGQLAIQHAKAVEEQMSKMDVALASRDEAETGVLRITVPPLVADRGFAEDMVAFQGRYPGVELLFLGDNKVLNLHRREADVALRIMSKPTESLWGRVIAHQRAGWFATPDFIEAHRATLEGQSGDALPIISFTAWPDSVPSELAGRYDKIKTIALSDDMVTAVNLAGAGLGMVRMACFISAQNPALVPVPQLSFVNYSPLWVLTQPELRRVPRVINFMQFIAGRFAERSAKHWGTEPAR